MPRLSLWREHKSNDFNFIDNSIREQFLIGGTAFLVHKYLGPEEQGATNDPSKPNYTASGGSSEIDIQDLLFLETRDRKYDQDIYELRGVYNVGDNDFDLTQFGLFLSNDVLFINFHINDMVEKLGRKLMPGDVFELPHLRDDLLLDPNADAINKFYVVQDASRGAEGFSQTWFPHIWRVKAAPITDSQEYKDIIGFSEAGPDGSPAADPDSLAADLSTAPIEFDISEAIVESAEDDNPTGVPLTEHLFNYESASDPATYDEYMGETIPQGIAFPATAHEGDYFVRNDFSPHRLFVRRGTKWHRLYDNVPGTKTWSERTYNAESFVNDAKTAIIDSEEFNERQPLSKVIKPKSDV